MEIKIEKDRIFVEDLGGNLLAEVLFPAVSEHEVDFNYTFISPSVYGNSLIGTLMRNAVAYVQSKSLTAKVTCPVARKWFDDNPGLARSLSIE